LFIVLFLVLILMNVADVSVQESSFFSQVHSACVLDEIQSLTVLKSIAVLILVSIPRLSTVLHLMSQRDLVSYGV
jgi:hypothetical protein